MSQVQTLRTNAPERIGELIVEADVGSLNAALADREIDPERIISILPIASQTLVTIAPEKFRVLYRMH